jgi:hypothetical protein
VIDRVTNHDIDSFALEDLGNRVASFHNGVPPPLVYFENAKNSTAAPLFDKNRARMHAVSLPRVYFFWRKKSLISDLLERQAMREKDKQKIDSTQ